MGETIFQCTNADEPAFSIEEQAFVQIMEKEIYGVIFESKVTRAITDLCM